MRRSREDKARSHERIVEVAAQRIREAGTETPAVAEIMQAAGMTHGGFYKHFASRDELIAEAAAHACASGAQSLAELTDQADDPLAALVGSYLSAEHRDAPSAGCGVAALAGDAARAGNPSRGAFTTQVREYAELLQRLLPATTSDPEARDRALAAVSSLVGALVLARGVDDTALSDEILAAARNSFFDVSRA